MTPGRVRALAVVAALIVALPLGGSAQTPPPQAVSLAFKGPAGWIHASIASSSFYIRDGDKLHTLTFGAVSPKLGTDVETYAGEQMAAERLRGAEIVDEGATTICEGVPGHRWTVRTASTGTPMEAHILAVAVTGGVGTATYSHKQGVGDRRDALEAMNNLCPGPFPNPVPAGWTAPKVRTGITLTSDSPDSTSTFIASYRMISADRFDAFERDSLPGGKIVSDHRDPCGTATVHRIDAQVGNQIAEVAIAYLHNSAYRYVYTRPAAHEADGSAERTLTAFCRANSPIPAGTSAPV
jgi:hypothetical protein